MRAMFIALLAAAALVPPMATIACGTVEASKPSVEVDMRNVDLHITPQARELAILVACRETNYSFCLLEPPRPFFPARWHRGSTNG